MIKMALLDLLKSAKIDFMQNQSGRKIANFPYCVSVTKNNEMVAYMIRDVIDRGDWGCGGIIGTWDMFQRQSCIWISSVITKGCMHIGLQIRT